MGSSSYLQTSFLGGEWATEVQGRSDTEAYKTGLNKCVNYYPVEQGSLLRRQGFKYIGHTLGGNPARLVGFDAFAANSISLFPLQLEFTDGFIRFISGSTFVTDSSFNVTSISNATPAVVTTSLPHGWTTGDTVIFTTDPYALLGPSPLYNLQFAITVTGASTFSIAANVGGASIVGTNIPTLAANSYKVFRIAHLVSPYSSSQWIQNTFLEDETQILSFNPRVSPRSIKTITANPGFSIGTFPFLDGPYLDINTTTTTLTPSAATGSITITASAVTGINPTNATPTGVGFRASDVGRHLRMLNQPLPWDPTSNAYVVGNEVLYVDGNVYVAIKNDNGPAANNGTAAVPTNIDHWALATNLPSWSWLIITGVTNPTHATATVQPSTLTGNSTLFNVLATTNWQLGLYNDTDGWPQFGAYHEGRLWLGGVGINRIDGSMSNAYGTFSPTGDDGTVGDANAIAFTIRTGEKNQFHWLAPNDQGLLIGSKTSEWTIRASALGDPITPSSIQARRTTKFGSARSADTSGLGPFIQPIFAHRMHVFVQRQRRKLIEEGHPTESLYSINTSTDLSFTASHLSVSGIEEIVYTAQPKPFIWARRLDGTLVGATYNRDGDKMTVGWHQHPLGGLFVSSISSGPSVEVNNASFSDRLYVVTNPAGSAVYSSMVLTDLFDDNKLDIDTFFVDQGISAIYYDISPAGLLGVRVYGLGYAVGATFSATVAGLDIGDAVVQSDGHADFPFSGLFTAAYMTNFQNTWPIQGYPPVIVGLTYTSKGQMLRPDHGNDAGARSGPAFGKIRRNHWWAMLVNRTQGLSVGTDFGNSLHPVKLSKTGGTSLAQPALYSGVLTDTITDDYSKEGMLSWQQTRPLPGQILVVGGYIETQDK